MKKINNFDLLNDLLDKVSGGQGLDSMRAVHFSGENAVAEAEAVGHCYCFCTCGWTGTGNGTGWIIASDSDTQQ